MALKINTDHIMQETDPYFGIKAKYVMYNVVAITNHNTANVASAVNEIEYMKVNPADKYYVSFHYAVDDQEAVQGLPLDRAGWHASDGELGTGNRSTIAVEMCYSYVHPTDDSEAAKAVAEAKWQKQYKAKFEKAMANAAELNAMLLKKYFGKCDLTKVTKHQDWGQKKCPHRILDNYGWDYFLNLVQEKYEELYPEDFPMTKAEKAQFEALEEKVNKLTTKLTTTNTQLTATKKALKEASDRLAEYDKAGVYDNAANRWKSQKDLPEWAQEPVAAALRTKGVDGKPVLRGDGNNLNLSKIKVEDLAFLQRTGNTK